MNYGSEVAAQVACAGEPDSVAIDFPKAPQKMRRPGGSFECGLEGCPVKGDLS